MVDFRYMGRLCNVRRTSKFVLQTSDFWPETSGGRLYNVGKVWNPTSKWRPNATFFRPILTSDRRCLDVRGTSSSSYRRPHDVKFVLHTSDFWPETSAGRLYNDIGVHTFRGRSNDVHSLPDFGVRPNAVHFVPDFGVHTLWGRFIDGFFGRRFGMCMVRAKKGLLMTSF